MIHIRKATKDDLITIVSFNQAMAKETEGKQLDSETVTKGVAHILNAATAKQSMENGFYLLAEIDGIVVGQLMITFEWSDWRNGNFWWIQSVYISPDYRKKGVYRKLYKEISNLAKAKNNVCGFRLYVDKSNKIALQTYHNLGMKTSNYVLMEKLEN